MYPLSRLPGRAQAGNLDGRVGTSGELPDRPRPAGKALSAAIRGKPGVIEDELSIAYPSISPPFDKTFSR